MRPHRAPPPVPRPPELDASLTFCEREHWFACRPGPSQSQGFKLYVPMTVLNAGPVLREAFEVLRDHALHFKYARDLKVLRRLNAGLHGYSQVGKNLVIYAGDPPRSLVEGLVARLGRFRGQCPTVPFARALGDDVPLYYRYGAYQGDEIELDGQRRTDERRDRHAAIPEGMPDPMAPFLRPPVPRPELRAFLARYPSIAALVQRGKGGVFKALDLSRPSYREVILRLGYPAGEVHDDGTDGSELVRRAQRFFARLQARGLQGLAPRLIDTHDDGRWAALVTELLPGEDLMTKRLEGRLGVEHLRASWALLGRMHAAGLYWGDAKLANVLATSQGVRAIDFETAGLVGHDSPLTMCSFQLEDPVLDDPQRFDCAHFLASVLVPLEPSDPEHASFSPRVVKLRELAAETSSSLIEQWARARLREVLSATPPHARQGIL